MAVQPGPPEAASPLADRAAAGSAPGRPPRRAVRRGLTAAALALALCGLAATAAGAVNQMLPRRFTAAQQRQIMAWETARRWRTTPAGQLFPAAITYQLPGAELNSSVQLALSARRLGIARQAACGAATDPAAAAILGRLGCAAVLRATYVDSTGSLVLTVGVAVLSGSTAAARAYDQLAGTGPGRPPGSLRPGVRSVSYQGTPAAAFGDAQRQLSSAVSAGPYLVMSTVGYADGRPQVRVSTDGYVDQEMSSLADGVASTIGGPLGSMPSVPHCPGAPGC